jgi:hypothetical protein
MRAKREDKRERGERERRETRERREGGEVCVLRQQTESCPLLARTEEKHTHGRTGGRTDGGTDGRTGKKEGRKEGRKEKKRQRSCFFPLSFGVSESVRLASHRLRRSFFLSGWMIGCTAEGKKKGTLTDATF